MPQGEQGKELLSSSPTSGSPLASYTDLFYPRPFSSPHCSSAGCFPLPAQAPLVLSTGRLQVRADAEV